MFKSVTYDLVSTESVLKAPLNQSAPHTDGPPAAALLHPTDTDGCASVCLLCWNRVVLGVLQRPHRQDSTLWLRDHSRLPAGRLAASNINDIIRKRLKNKVALIECCLSLFSFYAIRESLEAIRCFGPALFLADNLCNLKMRISLSTNGGAVWLWMQSEVVQPWRWMFYRSESSLHIVFHQHSGRGGFICFRFFCSQCRMHKVEYDFCLLCWKHSDSPSKQQRENIAHHPVVHSCVHVKNEIYVWHVQINRAIGETTLLTGPWKEAHRWVLKCILFLTQASLAALPLPSISNDTWTRAHRKKTLVCCT